MSSGFCVQWNEPEPATKGIRIPYSVPNPPPTPPPSQLPIPLSSAAFHSPLPLCSIAEISINAIQSCRAAANPIRTKIQIKYVKCCAGFCVSTSVYPVDSGRLVRNCIYLLKGILWSFNSSFPSSLPLSISLCLSSRNQTSVLYLYRVCVCVGKLWTALSRSRVKRLLDNRVGG